MGRSTPSAGDPGHPGIPETAWVFYDDGCRLCRGARRWIERRDRRRVFRFYPLHAIEGQRLVAGWLPPDVARIPDSLLVWADDGCYSHSDAVLAILSRLSFPWRLAALMAAIPAKWRDDLYRWLAERRHRMGCPATDRRLHPAIPPAPPRFARMPFHRRCGGAPSVAGPRDDG